MGALRRARTAQALSAMLAVALAWGGPAGAVPAQRAAGPQANGWANVAGGRPPEPEANTHLRAGFTSFAMLSDGDLVGILAGTPTAHPGVEAMTQAGKLVWRYPLPVGASVAYPFARGQTLGFVISSSASARPSAPVPVGPSLVTLTLAGRLIAKVSLADLTPAGYTLQLLRPYGAGYLLGVAFAPGAGSTAPTVCYLDSLTASGGLLWQTDPLPVCGFDMVVVGSTAVVLGVYPPEPYMGIVGRISLTTAQVGSLGSGELAGARLLALIGGTMIVTGAQSNGSQPYTTAIGAVQGAPGWRLDQSWRSVVADGSAFVTISGTALQVRSVVTGHVVQAVAVPSGATPLAMSSRFVLVRLPSGSAEVVGIGGAPYRKVYRAAAVGTIAVTYDVGGSAWTVTSGGSVLRWPGAAS